MKKEKILNKFNSTEELSTAYAELEREFTKRCQLVAELQAKLGELERKHANDGDSSAVEQFDGQAETNEGVVVQCDSVQNCLPSNDELSSEKGGTLDEFCENSPVNDEPQEQILVGGADGKEVVEPVGIVSIVTPISAVATTEKEVCVVPAEKESGEKAVCDNETFLSKIVERAGEIADELSLIPEVMEACLTRYKRGLMGMGMSSPLRGNAVITPVMRPKTLSEAKRLADELLK